MLPRPFSCPFSLSDELPCGARARNPHPPLPRFSPWLRDRPEHKAAGWKTPIWDSYKSIIVSANGATQFEEVERFAFYERSKKAFAIVATGETALYGNLILKKGIIGSDGK